MLCPKCGEKVPENAAFCPFCSADLRPAAVPPASPVPTPLPVAAPPVPAAVPPPPPPVPAVTVPPSPPVYAAPVGVPPAPPQVAPSARSSGCGAAVGVVVALLIVLLVLGGVGAYIAINKLHLAPPTRTATSATTPPAPDDSTARPDSETARPSPAAQEPTADEAPATEADPLSKYAGTWEFVGEPSPWGEGFGMELKVESGKLVGRSGTEGFEVRIELQERNGALQGQSTDPDNGTIPLEIAPTDNAGVMTLKYRIRTGEWLTRVIKRQGGNADWVG